MPAIKKRITAEYQKREQQHSEHNGRNSSTTTAEITADRSGGGDSNNDSDDNEDLPHQPADTKGRGASGDSAVKRRASSGPHLLKGLDGEVLVEKRKRTMPPAELKLDSWLEDNFEKKADSHLSVKKLYQFYTELCQQESTTVLELEVFRHMLVNKFGKEFGIKDNSAYSGLLKAVKPRKKPVVAASCGYKLKDLIHEALTASGNPTKGVMFSWVKKFIASKYPALQIDIKSQYLRSTLQRELRFGHLELVKGIGFCGFYRIPGPADEEKEAKGKKNKTSKKTEKGAESVDDTADTAEEENGKKSAEKSEDSAEEMTEDKEKKPSTDTEESMEETTGDGKEEKSDEKKENKKAVKKKRKRSYKPKWTNVPRHCDPQTLNDVFPLAMTYMAEPKEASFTRIRKYIEKYFDKIDIDSRLKRCMEHGCETGLWDRVSGSGASGSFKLQVDSFNPEHTESLTDMVCSAIIACTEPKTSSVRLLKNYITEHHPEFNIDTRPVRLRLALERAEKQNQLRRISGIGMSGSFQLVEQFTPSPAILAGDADSNEGEEDDDDDYAGKGKAEVYVVRQTKSGRRVPVEKTQVDFSATYKKKAARGKTGSRGGGGVTSKRKSTAAAKKKPTAANDSSSQEESEPAEEEEDSEEEVGYKPRPTKSRGSGGGGRGGGLVSRPPPAKKKPPPPSPAKEKEAGVKGRSQGQRGSSKQSTVSASSKKGSARQALAPASKTPRRTLPSSRKVAEEKEQEEEKEEEEDKEEEESDDSPSPPSKKGNASQTSAAKTPRRPLPSSRKTEVKEEEEEKEEEKSDYSPSPPSKKGNARQASAPAAKTPRRPLPSSRKAAEDKEKEEEKEEEEDDKEEEEYDDSPSLPSKKSSARQASAPAAKTPRRPLTSSRKAAEEKEKEEEKEEEVEKEEEESDGSPSPPPPSSKGRPAPVLAKKSEPAARVTRGVRVQYQEADEDEEEDDEPRRKQTGQERKGCIGRRRGKNTNQNHIAAS